MTVVPSVVRVTIVADTTVFGVPIADVFTEWHRRWTETPDEFATWAESVATPADDYGKSAALTLLAIAHEMSKQGKESAE